MLTPDIMDGSGRTVTVFLSHDSFMDKRNFRCINCGWCVCQTEAEIGLIIDRDEPPYTKSPVDIKCHRCKMRYRFLW